MMKRSLRFSSWGILTVLLIGPFASAHAQTSQSSETPVQGQSSSSAQEKPKPKKTWTDDDVKSLRKPWDNYGDVAAQSPAGASAKQSTAAPGNAASSGSHTTAPSDPSLPKTNEEAEKRIHEKEAEIQQKQQVLDKAAQDVESADNDIDRSALKSNMQIAKVDLEMSKDDLKKLQARQAELRPEASTQRGSEQTTPPVTQ